jgi:outer membrane protein assembly factor BamB
MPSLPLTTSCWPAGLPAPVLPSAIGDVLRAAATRAPDQRARRVRLAAWRAAAVVAMIGGLAVTAAPQALASPTDSAGPGDSARASVATAPSIRLSVSTGPPTQTVTVSGKGFGASEAVDIYLDTTDEAVTETSATGSFSGAALRVPAAAVPGTHWISAEGRNSGLFAQRPFTVDTPWAGFGRVARHTHDNPFENVLNPGNVSGLDEAWAFPAGYVQSSPAVVGGVVYAGSFDDNFYALSAATGAKIWSTSIGAAVISSPAVAGGAVYFGAGDGNVYALNAATGAKLWTFTTGGEVPCSPTVADGIVYIGSDDGTLYALNAATGAKVWSFTTGFEMESSPAVAGGVIYAAGDRNVYALSAATGAELWSFQTGDTVFSSPAVAGGVVYAGSADGNLYALDAATGARLWSAATGGSVYSSPAVTNGTVYVGSTDGNVYAYDLAGAAQAPRRPRPGALHPDLSLR